MAYACDICNSVMSDPSQIATLIGWYKLEEAYPATARKAALRRSVPLYTQPSVGLHFCISCVESKLAKDVRLNEEKSPSVLYEERRLAYPNESPIAARRKSVSWILDATCDRCEETYDEQYVELKSGWTNKEKAHKACHLCSSCHRSFLMPLADKI